MRGNHLFLKSKKHIKRHGGVVIWVRLLRIGHFEGSTMQGRNNGPISLFRGPCDYLVSKCPFPRWLKMPTPQLRRIWVIWEIISIEFLTRFLECVFAHSFFFQFMGSRLSTIIKRMDRVTHTKPGLRSDPAAVAMSLGCSPKCSTIILTLWPRPAVISTRNSVETQNLGPHPGLAEWEVLGAGTRNLCFNKLSKFGKPCAGPYLPH